MLSAPLTGVVLTKLDGTAKGGICDRCAGYNRVPIKLVGMGEGINDIYDFEPVSFVEALLGGSEE